MSGIEIGQIVFLSIASLGPLTAAAVCLAVWVMDGFNRLIGSWGAFLCSAAWVTIFGVVPMAIHPVGWAATWTFWLLVPSVGLFAFLCPVDLFMLERRRRARAREEALAQAILASHGIRVTDEKSRQ